LDPLTAYRLKQQQMKKKKGPNYPAIGVGIGAAVLLVILAVVFSQSSTPPSQPGAPPVTSKVSVAERERMKVYSELPRYKEMLRTNGGSAMDAYRVVGKMHNISASDVQQIEVEGSSKGWPK
jgi:hypothetical protein